MSSPESRHHAEAVEATLAIVRASGVEAVLRAAAESACRLTGSAAGLAGLSDGETATSDGVFTAESGWQPERRRWEVGRGGPGRVCASGTPLIANGVPRTGLDGSDDFEHFVCAPLIGVDGEVLGFLEAGDRDGGYGPHDARGLTALAAVAALRLAESASSSRLGPEDQAALADVAERLQDRLLPAPPPALHGIDIAFAYRSASTGVLSGGDFVDYYTRPPSSSLAFAIGDVAGKGVDAMATTFATKYILRAAIHGSQLSWPARPGEALQELRNGLLEQPDFGPESERFVTVLFGELSPRLGTLQLASAGHPAPFLVRRAGVERPLLLTEPAVGVELGAALGPYPSETLHLEPGDLLVAFTDGIAELRDECGEFFEERMPAVLEGSHGHPAAAVVDGLLAAAGRFSCRSPADDIAVLCVGLTPPSMDEPGL